METVKQQTTKGEDCSPSATFDIYDDEELYCRGIVLELSDIENYLKN